jgi:hypothetical protein
LLLLPLMEMQSFSSFGQYNGQAIVKRGAYIATCDHPILDHNVF